MSDKISSSEAALQETPRSLEVTDSPWVGRSLLLMVVCLWSLSGFFAKSPMFADWPEASKGPLMAFWRALFAGVLLLPIVRRPRMKPLMIPQALVFTALNLTYLTSMAFTTAANAIWLQAIAPVWVCIFGWLFFRQLAKRSDLVMMIFGLLGVSVILIGSFLYGSTSALRPNEALGVILAIVSGACLGITILLMQQLRNEDPAWIVAFNHLVTAAIIAPLMIAQGVWPSYSQLGVLAIFGFVQMGIPYMLFIRALHSVSSQEASGICLLEPVLVPVWVWICWNEFPDQWTLYGASLILLGLIIRYLNPFQKRMKFSQ